MVQHVPTPQQLDRERLKRILQAESVEDLSLPEIIRLFREEEGIADFLPDGAWEIDPRSGDRVLFHSSRGRRPHDNVPSEWPLERNKVPSSSSATKSPPACAICQGNTTGVIDVADLSEGFTFINKNLYPVLYPWETGRSGHVSKTVDRSVQMTSWGMHFLQWTSSLHDRDWHNIPLVDCATVMRRLAALEKTLLTGCRELLPPSEPRKDCPEAPGYVLILKNYGRLVGGSLAHGHQQIVFSTVAPRRVLDNWRFEQEYGETFSAFLMRENPTAFVVRDYGPALLLVPYFMRRPYDMTLIMKDTAKRHLYELTDAEITAVAAGWHDAICAMRWMMRRIGRELAYNVITNNGPGAGLYFEFLPYVQEIGGAEHLGLFISQDRPERAAAQLRQYLEGEQRGG